jgi:hypothetical protein
MKVALYIPNSYLLASQKEKDEVCNGCGAKDGAKVPDYIWFLSILLACKIHDWMFEKGKTQGDYWFANLIFFWNMTALVINGSANKAMIILRMGIVLVYFLGVMTRFGISAYWVKKEKNEDNTITIKGSLV